jgi:TetR/AcrR family transcriptional regulator, cholesterol catabolism regulator
MNDLHDIDVSGAKQRVLDAAEELFMECGFSAVTLRDVATKLGMRQASLYYHFPGGKEELYLVVTERAFLRHRAGMEAVCLETPPGVQAQLQAVVDWFESQPAVNVMGMMYADLPALSAEGGKRMAQNAYNALFHPLRTIFVEAQKKEEILEYSPDLLAGFFLAMLDGITFSETQQSYMDRKAMGRAMIQILLNGLRPRKATLS